MRHWRGLGCPGRHSSPGPVPAGGSGPSAAPAEGHSFWAAAVALAPGVASPAGARGKGHRLCGPQKSQTGGRRTPSCPHPWPPGQWTTRVGCRPCPVGTDPPHHCCQTRPGRVLPQGCPAAGPAQATAAWPRRHPLPQVDRAHLPCREGQTRLSRWSPAAEQSISGQASLSARPPRPPPTWEDRRGGERPQQSQTLTTPMRTSPVSRLGPRGWDGQAWPRADPTLATRTPGPRRPYLCSGPAVPGALLPSALGEDRPRLRAPLEQGSSVAPRQAGSAPRAGVGMELSMGWCRHMAA